MVALDYLDITKEDTMNELLASAGKVDTKTVKEKALARLGITVQEGQSALGAWVLAMCRKNGLEEKLPNTVVGDAALEICPRWVFWLA